MDNNLKNIIRECNQPFANEHFSTPKQPVLVGYVSFSSVGNDVNHYLVKNKNDSTLFTDSLNPYVGAMIEQYIMDAESRGLSPNDRYVYVTINQGYVKKDTTMRDPGWHMDGMQGDEVEEKTNACYQYIWSDELPTEFAIQGFDASGLDPSTHNYFDSLAKQVDKKKVGHCQKGASYLMNVYMLHRGAIARKTVRRKFIRVYFSHQKITSEKMTVNPDINYDYEIHTTSGNIPEHLITL